MRTPRWQFAGAAFEFSRPGFLRRSLRPSLPTKQLPQGHKVSPHEIRRPADFRPFGCLSLPLGFRLGENEEGVAAEDEMGRQGLAPAEIEHNLRDPLGIADLVADISPEQIEHGADAGLVVRHTAGALPRAISPQPVRMPPGSTLTILTPNGATSLAITSVKPPTAHFADW
jgi:hypothetical protein